MIEFTFIFHTSNKEFNSLTYQGIYKSHAIAKQIKIKRTHYEENVTFKIIKNQKEFNYLDAVINYIDGCTNEV